MQCNTIGIDLAKSVFELAIADVHWRLVDRKRLNRSEFLRYFQNRQPAQLVMEACGSAHYWARTLQALGHSVTLLPAQYVKAYVRRNKHDRADAAALIEAFRGKQILPVVPKTEQQQAIQGLHRTRQQWVRTRTARLNLLRALLREQGHCIAAGACQVLPAVQALKSELPPPLQPVVDSLTAEIHELESRIGVLEKQLKQWAREQPAVQLLQQIPGIGLLSATALVASIGNPSQFRNGRHMSAWLGLTPREYSSGNKRFLGRISKRGDVYLRTLFVHGARAVLNRAVKQCGTDTGQLHALQHWAVTLKDRVGYNKATIALANKLARICWASWFHQTPFEAKPV